MDLNKLPLLTAMIRQMDWLNERQRTIAQNIANSDTPGYRPHDLKPIRFADLMSGGDGGSRLAPTVTDPAHLVSGGDGRAAAARSDVQRRTYETAPTGNAVVLEEQMMKLAETQIEYTTLTNLYRKQIGLLKVALGKR